MAKSNSRKKRDRVKAAGQARGSGAAADPYCVYWENGEEPEPKFGDFASR